jgi:hypothetical protein
MTRSEAIQIVSNAIGREIVEPSPLIIEAIGDIELLGQMIENQGGKLRSRQVISLVILLAEKRVTERHLPRH